MGFGILFIGYFFTYIGAITPFSTFTSVIGTGIIIFSLKNLIYENKFFLASLIASIILELVSIPIMFMSVLGATNYLFYDILLKIQGYMIPILNIILVIAIYLIAKQVGLPKLQAKSIVDMIIIGIYFVSATIFNLLNNEFLMERLFIVNVFAQLIYTIFTLIIIFNCYMRICYEGDENMEGDTIGIKPLDFLNRALNKVMNKNKDDNDKTRKK